MEEDELQGLLSVRDTEIINLKEQLKAASKASSNPAAARQDGPETPGREGVVNVKITRKRKSAEIDKDDVHSETRRNPRTGPTPKLAVQQDEPSPAGGSKDQGSMRPQDSQSSLQSRKEGTMRKIGRLPPELPNILRGNILL
ncbi:unnamed protein product [Coregonus sp. 'balchen']|nr:unnamed protein product [Coregonus sp. 'balchen']